MGTISNVQVLTQSVQFAEESSSFAIVQMEPCGHKLMLDASRAITGMTRICEACVHEEPTIIRIHADRELKKATMTLSCGHEQSVPLTGKINYDVVNQFVGLSNPCLVCRPLE